MKKLIVVASMFLLSMNCFADDLNDVRKITLQGFKAIRHDALLRLKFRKVHEMNLKIKELESEIKKG